MICGLPGSGKTTLAKVLERKLNAIRMCPDEWIEAILADPHDQAEKNRLRDVVENLQWSLAKTYLAQGFIVVLENGFWSRDERSQYAMEAREIGARIELYSLDSSDRDELWRRIESRNQTLTSPIWLMRREDHEPHWTGYEAPTEEEIAFYDAGSIL